MIDADDPRRHGRTTRESIGTGEGEGARPSLGQGAGTRDNTRVVRISGLGDTQRATARESEGPRTGKARRRDDDIARTHGQRRIDRHQAPRIQRQ